MSRIPGRRLFLFPQWPVVRPCKRGRLEAVRDSNNAPTQHRYFRKDCSGLTGGNGSRSGEGGEECSAVRCGAVQCGVGGDFVIPDEVAQQNSCLFVTTRGMRMMSCLHGWGVMGWDERRDGKVEAGEWRVEEW
jgi:hypothetical protein